jgi:hypothetical protein
MPHSKSRHTILLARFGDIELRQKLLELRRDSFSPLFNRFFLLAVILLGLVLAWWRGPPGLPHILLSAAFLILFAVRLVVPWRCRRQIEQLKAEKQNISNQLADAVQDQVEFMEKFRKETKSFKRQLERPTYSPLCTIWDRITRSYRSNPKALICPVCGAHNGLHDPANPPVYICPNCGSLIGGNE